MQPLGRIKKRFPDKQDSIKHDNEYCNWWEDGISNDGCKKTSRRQGRQSIQRQLIEIEEDRAQQIMDDLDEYEKNYNYGGFIDHMIEDMYNEEE